jgi:hypothetical protein
MTDYPIISQRSLLKVGRRGIGGILPARREASDLPLPKPHEALVYKTGGSYIVDDGSSRTTDAHIVNATNITVVDMREDAPITVETSIPSAGEVEFIVRVTFLCTVKKPEEVVDAGLSDITTSLTNYLIQHQALFHLGEDYQLSQAGVVWRNVTAEVRAFFSVRPPHFRGLDVKLGNVQVLTPGELHKQQRDREMEALLMSGQQQTEHRLAEERAELQEIRRRNDETFELERRRHAQSMEHMQQQMTQMQEAFQRQLAQQQLEHEQRLRTSTFQHAADEAERLKHVLDPDGTQMATVFTAAAGARGVAETADALNEERERRRQQKAGDALRRETWAREDAQDDRDRKREDAQYKRQIERENTQLHYQMELTRLKAQAEVIATGINRGLADHRDIEHVTSVLNGVVKTLEGAAATPAQNTGADGKAQQEKRAGDTADGPVRAEAATSVVEAEVISDSTDAADDPGAGVREDDLG